MYNLNHRQLTLISLIIGLSFFRFKKTKRLKFYLQKNLFKTTGLFIDVTKPYVKTYKEIGFKHFYIKINQKKLFLIEDLIIRYDFRVFLKTNSISGSILEINSKKVKIIINPKYPNSYGFEENLNFEENDSLLWEKKYYPLFYSTLMKFFNHRINNIKINLIYIKYNNGRYSFGIENLKLDKEVVNGEGFCKTNDFSINLPFNLIRDIQEQKIFIQNNSYLKIFNKGKEIFTLGGYNFSLEIKDKYNFFASGSLRQIHSNFKILSNTPIIIKNIEYEFDIHFTKNIFKISKESGISINNIPLAFNLYHDWKERDLIKISIISIIEGSTFFRDYPFFNLNNMCSIKAKGDLIIRTDYLLSMANLKKYHFHSEVLKNTFNVVDYEQFDLSYIASDFEHRVFLDDGCSKDVKVSKNNPDFIELNEIPKELTNIIVLTEDPDFFSHFGVDGYNIGNAIALNILERKIVKGASTITMQVARNLFLNHSRNFTRKIDEMIIAWLLENHFKISKDRILEIYLNIIEFGSNTWGIGEASKFYFDKDIRILELTEFMVLSYIIPRPKYFLDAFLIKSPQLRNNLKNHIQDCAIKLYKNGLISTEDYNNINYDIKLKEEFGSFQLL